MTLKVKLIHTTPLDSPTFTKVCDLGTGDPQAGVIGIRQYLNGYINSSRLGQLTCNVGEVSATGKIILAGEPTSGDTFSVANITFTGTSGTNDPTVPQFNIGTSVTQTASNIVTVVNASTAGSYVHAASTAGTVTFIVNTSGNVGNAVQLSSALTNGTAGLVAFTGGSIGTSYNLNLH